MKSYTKTALSAGILALAARASAQVASTCPATNVCYKLNIPANTASTGSGDIFFQISAPSTYEWVALGQGDSMGGSNMFLVYTSQDGSNVTLSPRTTSGHNPPSFNKNAQATLLEGSGVSNGIMTANVKCSNCNSWSGGSTMDFKASSGNWIYAFNPSNGPKNTNDQSVRISQHTGHDSFTWSFANAKGGSSVNPLVNAAPSDNGSNSTNGGTSGSGVTSTGSSSSNNERTKLIAHGTLASLAFVILFPSGAIAIRLASFPGIVWIHGAFQVFAYLVYIAAFGLGVHIATQNSLLGRAHPIIGIVVFILVFFQPIGGYLHHLMFKKHGRRTMFSHAHIWGGRIAITLGIINGGLGLKLADSFQASSTGGMIAYGVVAGLMWLAWVAASIIGEMRRKTAAGPKLGGRRGSNESPAAEVAPAKQN